MAEQAKTLGDALNDLLEAAEPAFKRAAQALDETAEKGRIQYEERRTELRRDRAALDRKLDQRWRRR